MRNEHPRPRMFPALLKHWRRQRGLSQLDLALAAGVSSRHVSFLETARATPSIDMVLRLAAALDVPLRHVNAMLQAAGHEAVYPESPPGQDLPDEVDAALKLMKEHHDPFPLVVIDRSYDVVDLNAGARAVFGAVVPNIEAIGEPLNLARLTFDPRGARDALLNFDEVGRALLWRIQREILADPGDGPLRDVLEEILAMPTVDDDWREADLGIDASPALFVHLEVGGAGFRFLTMVTALQAPQTVALDELRIETWFPTDAATADGCRKLVGAAT